MPPRDIPGRLSGTILVHGDHVTGMEVAPSISVTTSKAIWTSSCTTDMIELFFQLSEPHPIVILKGSVPRTLIDTFTLDTPKLYIPKWRRS